MNGIGYFMCQLKDVRDNYRKKYTNSREVIQTSDDITDALRHKESYRLSIAVFLESRILSDVIERLPIGRDVSRVNRDEDVVQPDVIGGL